MIHPNDPTLLETLRNDEAFRQHPYHCTGGKLTIGYGRNLDDVGISEVEADMMLLRDVAGALESAHEYRWFDDLNLARQRVIVEMIFQLGAKSFFGFRLMRAALQDRDYDRAAVEMLNSKWARDDTPERAQRAAKRMREG